MQNQNIKNDPFKDLKNVIAEIQQMKEKTRKSRDVIVRTHPRFGKYIKIDGVLIAIDHWNPEADFVYISHAHMDHIPNIPKKVVRKIKEGRVKTNFICSKITKEVSELRLRRDLPIHEENWILGKNLKKKNGLDFKGVRLKLLKNGHAYGSTSLLIEGSKKILYTSDFIGENKYFGGNKTALKRLEPIKCDILITECTYGKPKFNFPRFEKIKSDLNLYVNETLAAERPVILLGYSFGKSQAILNMLEQGKEILLERGIVKIVKLLEANNISFSDWEPYGNYNKNQLSKSNDYVLIIPPYYIFSEPYKTLIKNGALLVHCTGKVLNQSEREKFPSNKYIPYSDHCQFSKLISFIEKCHPDLLYLIHGLIREFYYYLSSHNINMINIIDNNSY